MRASTPRSRRRFAVLVATVLLVASCTDPDSSGGAGTTSTTTAPAGTTTPPTETTPTGAVDSTTSTSTSTTSTLPVPDPIKTNPLTVRTVQPDEMLIMPFEELPTPWAGWVRSDVGLESNARLATVRVQDPHDEAIDAETFGRLDGVRASYRPRFVGGDVVAVDAWAMLFATDRGAAGYLDDYLRDAAKGQDGGRSGNYAVTGVQDFAIDTIGDQTIGFTLEELRTGGGSLHQTIVGVRIGRMLGFVALARIDDADMRIAAQDLATAFHKRIVDVLVGEIRPEPPEVDPDLTIYAFSYDQALTERYTTVVTEVPDFDGEDDEVDPQPDPGSGSSTTTTTPGSTTTTSSTTTTTRIISIENTGRITTTGIATAGDDVDCAVDYALPTGLRSTRYVVAGGNAWQVEGDLIDVVDPDQEPAAGDLLYCPGWNVALDLSGLSGIVVPGTGERTTLDGQPVERFELTAGDLFAVGLGPADGSGVDLDYFTVWLSTLGPWIVGVDISYDSTTEALEPVLGPGFYPGADVTIDVSFRATRLNDASLEIVPPAAAPGEGTDDGGAAADG